MEELTDFTKDLFDIYETSFTVQYLGAIQSREKQYIDNLIVELIANGIRCKYTSGFDVDGNFIYSFKISCSMEDFLTTIGKYRVSGVTTETMLSKICPVTPLTGYEYYLSYEEGKGFYNEGKCIQGYGLDH